jgi:hypothetical protein
MTKLPRRVRFRGTSMEGYISKRVIHNGEAVYLVQWDHDIDEDPRPYSPNDLESNAVRVDRQNLQIIKRADAMDRKWWEEQMTQYGTVEAREEFRSGRFERI